VFDTLLLAGVIALALAGMYRLGYTDGYSKGSSLTYWDGKEDDTEE